MALGVSGAVLVAVALIHQHHPVAPPLTVAASTPLPQVRSTASTATAKPLAPPKAISIPAIGVRSQLLQLGLARDGSVQVPPVGPHYNQAGWYRYSPVPGAPGPAVVLGHVDSVRSGPSVFFRLGELRPGSRVLVTGGDGGTVQFAVTTVRRYSKHAFPSDLVYGDTTGPELRLITCGGRFDPQTGSYEDNVVVSAKRV